MSPPMIAATKPSETGSVAQFAIKRVGVVGLGHMGRAFAANLVADGYRVSVFDRDKERIAALLPTGARGAERLADLAD